MASTTLEEAVITEEASGAKPSLLAVLRVRNFRLLWLAEGISVLGDQFHFVALPWLVLQLTGSGLAVGSVLAVAGIPRAMFMLVGGALTDRLSPRTVMLISNWMRAAIVGLMTVMVVSGLIQLWMLYVMALLFGFLDGFFLPAQGAMLPRIVSKEQLEPANAITQITAQLSQFVGPALGGLIIATFSGQAATAAGGASTEGISIALGFDAFTFVFAAIAIWLMTHVSKTAVSDKSETPEMLEAASQQGLLGSIKEGLQIVWQDEALRVMVLFSAIINFLINGAISIGLPILANLRFEEGAAAFGMMISSFGGGALIGAISAGVLPRPKRFGMAIIFLIFNFGLGLLLLNGTTNLLFAMLIGAGMGIGAGYANVMMSAWMQRRTDPEAMGRVMGVVMFSSMGLQPIAMMLAGFLADISLDVIFLGAGGLLILTAAFALTLRPMRDLG